MSWIGRRATLPSTRRAPPGIDTGLLFQVKSIQVFMTPINTWLAVNMIEAFKARRTVPVQSASVPSSRNETPANDEVPRPQGPTSMREAPVRYKFVGTLAHEGETFNHVNEGVDLPPGLRVVSPDNTAEMTEAVTASDWVICSIADNHDTTAQVASLPLSARPRTLRAGCRWALLSRPAPVTQVRAAQLLTFLLHPRSTSHGQFST